MEQELIQLIKDLTNKVNILYNDKERQGTSHEQRMNIQNSGVEDPHLRVRAPAYKEENYPELIEEFHDIEDEIFKSPLKEDERKHEKIRSGRTVDPDNDDDIISMKSIRRLITDLASSISQSMIENIHKSLEFPGKAPQMVEPT
ncbi:hypothetical protein AYI69_g8898, partial [Smittium culicis]